MAKGKARTKETRPAPAEGQRSRTTDEDFEYYLFETFEAATKGPGRPITTLCTMKHSDDYRIVKLSDREEYPPLSKGQARVLKYLCEARRKGKVSVDEYTLTNVAGWRTNRLAPGFAKHDVWKSRLIEPVGGGHFRLNELVELED